MHARQKKRNLRKKKLRKWRKEVRDSAKKKVPNPHQDDVLEELIDKPKLKLDGLKEKSRRVRAQRRLAARRAGDLVRGRKETATEMAERHGLISEVTEEEFRNRADEISGTIGSSYEEE